METQALMDTQEPLETLYESWIVVVELFTSELVGYTLIEKFMQSSCK